MMRNAIVFSLLGGLCLAQDDAQEKDLWMQDFAAAKAKAKAEKKDLLVDFTGSDWCGWCIRLDNEVFSKDEFKNSAPKNFVLVKLDYPRDESLVTDEIRAQNEKLQTQYSIQGFPTILLMDHDGQVYGQTGYQQGGPAPYNEMLAEKRAVGDKFKTALATAADKQGAERAKALDAALGTLEEQVAQTYHYEIMKQIVGLDADNAAGLKDKYAEQLEQIEMQQQLQTAGQKLNEMIGADMQAGEGEKALAKLEEVIKKPANKVEHQMALFFKGMVVMETSGDAKKAIAVLEQAVKLNPKSPIAQQIESIMPRIKQAAESGGDDGGK